MTKPTLRSATTGRGRARDGRLRLRALVVSLATLWLLPRLMAGAMAQEPVPAGMARAAQPMPSADHAHQGEANASETPTVPTADPLLDSAPAIGSPSRSIDAVEIRWSKILDNAPFGARLYAELVSYNGRIYWIGGDLGGVTLRDVWSSADGVSWRRETSNAAFGNRTWHTATVFDGKMWVFSGNSGGPILGDYYYSTNGITWVRPPSAPLLTVRAPLSAAVHEGQVFLAGAYNGTDHVASSSDLLSWTILVSGGSDEYVLGHWPQIGSFAGYLFGKGRDLPMYRSADGRAWEAVMTTPASEGTFEQVGSVFLFLYNTGGGRWTADGESWRDLAVMSAPGLGGSITGGDSAVLNDEIYVVASGVVWKATITAVENPLYCPDTATLLLTGDGTIVNAEDLGVVAPERVLSFDPATFDCADAGLTIPVTVTATDTLEPLT